MQASQLEKCPLFCEAFPDTWMKFSGKYYQQESDYTAVSFFMVHWNSGKERELNPRKQYYIFKIVLSHSFDELRYSIGKSIGVWNRAGTLDNRTVQGKNVAKMYAKKFEIMIAKGTVD